MRDSNYRAVLGNRAAITITNTLYDRRALDASSDKPLVNSLNYLTYLASSLQKVRETLAIDGGIERLIDILHECHNTCCATDNCVINAEKKILTAWKWTLALQCLVLVGTRGTDTIRGRMVDAGILPVLATILDNFLFLYDRPRVGQPSYPFHPPQPTFVVEPNIEPRRREANAFSYPESLVNPFRNFDDGHVATVAPLPATFTDQGIQEALTTNDGQHLANTPAQEQWQSSPNRWESHSESHDPELPDSSQASSSSTISGEGDLLTGMGPHASIGHPEISHDKHPGFQFEMDDLDGLTTEQLFGLVRELNGHHSVLGQPAFDGETCHPSYNGVRQRLAARHILERFKRDKQSEVSFDAQDSQFYHFNMDTNLHFLKDHTIISGHGAGVTTENDGPKISVRSFTPLGVVIPHEDDVIWALQLLAYISKQSSMKLKLQSSNLLVDMSVRDKHVKRMVDVARRGFDLAPTPLQPWNPAAIHQVKALAMPSILEFYVRGLSMDHQQFPDNKIHLSIDDGLEAGFDHTCTMLNCNYCETKNNGSGVCGFNYGHGNSYESSRLASGASETDYTQQLRGKITATKTQASGMERDVALCHLQSQMEVEVERKAKELAQTIRSKHRDQRRYLSRKWNYEDYDGFRIDGVNKDQDEALIVHKTVNLFPLVEKFTFLTGTDMYYWAGVIMRNSCRRCESRGSVRQCGNTECGKWESYPREFSKCRRCKRTKYCSRECQTKAWACHRNWCVQSTSSATATNTTITTNNTSNHPSSTNYVTPMNGDRNVRPDF